MLSYVHTKSSEEKQENRMNFEFLPNDILFELFEYFNGVDLLRAFLGLNYRFNNLIYEEFRAYRFDFTSIGEYDFGLICQYHLPCIADRIISLSFFDNADAREKINLFFRTYHHSIYSLIYEHYRYALFLHLDYCWKS